MADKVVEIPGVGIVAFPDSMSDDDIGKQAERLTQNAKNDALKAANAKPLNEPTTKEGGIAKSVGETAYGYGKGIVQSGVSAARGFSDMASGRGIVKAGVAAVNAARNPDQARADIKSAGQGVVDEAKAVAAGDPEAGGRATGNLLLMLAGGPTAAEAVESRVPGYIERARAYTAARVPSVGVSPAMQLRIAKAIESKGLTGAPAKLAADAVIKRIEAAAKPKVVAGKIVGKAPSLDTELMKALEEIRIGKTGAGSVEIAPMNQNPQAATDTMRMLSGRETARASARAPQDIESALAASLQQPVEIQPRLVKASGEQVPSPAGAEFEPVTAPVAPRTLNDAMAEAIAGTKKPTAVERGQATQQMQAVARASKIKLTADEVKAGMDLVARGVDPQKALEMITAFRESSVFSKLKAPTAAETKFTKGMRGGQRPLESVSERRYAELLAQRGGTQR